MKQHKFDVEDAKKYGIEKAILLEHLKFHQESNTGNDQMTFNKKPHAFIKPDTIKRIYSYMSYDSIRRWLRELEEDGAIESIKPHAKDGNHLKYYHVIGHQIPNGQSDQSNGQDNQSWNGQSDQSSIVTNVNKPSEGATPYEIPSKDQVEDYFRDRDKMLEEDISIEAQKFINHYSENEWRKNNGNRIKYWKKQANTWYQQYKQWNRDRIKDSNKSAFRTDAVHL